MGSSPVAGAKNSRKQSDREFLLFTSSLFTKIASENFEVRGNSEK